MAADTPPAPVTEIGYQVATPGYQWWLHQTETTPELQWPMSVQVYDQMRRTDGQCKSVLNAVTLPVLRTPWRVDPNGAREEVVQLVADDLGLPIVGRPLPNQPIRQRDRFDWVEHLRLALLMLPFGHSYFEQVYRVEDDGSRAHLRKLAYRPPTTIEQIDVAADGGLVAIKQYWTQTNSSPRPIPVDRLVAYIFDREGGNWLGTSILRPVYKNWLLKDRLLRVWAQTIERNGMGIPVYEAAETEQSLAAGMAMATKLRAGEAAGAATPNGAKLRLMGVEGTLPDAKPAVEYHDQQIARAVLAHFLNLGQQTGTGSWALGSTFADFFTLSLQTLGMQIAKVATQHVVEDLVDVNFGPDEPAPKLVFDEIGSRQPATAEAMKTLVDAGILHPDEVLEGAARQYYGLPPADPATSFDVEAAPDEALPADTPTPEAEQPFGAESVAASAGVDLNDEASWIAAAAGVDTHPGGERLKKWWVFGPGAARWATWTQLYDELKGHIKNVKLLKATVSAWYKLRYGHMPPHHKGVHASADGTSPEALEAFAEEFSEADSDGEADEWEMGIDALSTALDELSGHVTAAFNADLHPRNPKGAPGGGRFRSTVDRLKDALTEHKKSGGKGGDPFEGFDREQLRRAAVKQGVKLDRGESRDSIAEKLMGHIAPPKSNSRAEKMAQRQEDAGKKAAGIGVRPDSPSKRARRERIEKQVNDALDERARRDRWAAAATGERALASARVDFTNDTLTMADAPDWTDDQIEGIAEALGDYTSDGYERINGSLRRGVAEPTVNRMVGAMDRAMSASTLSEPVVVHRGIKSGPAVFGDAWSSDSVVGLTWKDLGYTSTTADPSVARDATSDLPDSVTMRVFVPPGTSALRLSDMPTDGPKILGTTAFEAELLLERGLTFRVVADHGYDERLHTRKLDVEVVPS